MPRVSVPALRTTHKSVGWINAVSVRDPPDVDVELAALDHPQRLKLLRIHVLEMLGELLGGNRDRSIGRCLLEDDRLPLTTAASLAGLRTEVRGKGDDRSDRTNGQ
jgi:hypothetical protein